MTRRKTLTTRWAGIGRFLGDQAGASFVITALSFPVILGFAGLGLDAAMWYADKRQNQTIADSAAVAGRIALSRDSGISASDLEIVVRGAAADNGFVHGTHGAVTVNSPPAAGPNVGDANFIEVVVAQQAQTYFSGPLLNESFMVRRRPRSSASLARMKGFVACSSAIVEGIVISAGVASCQSAAAFLRISRTRSSFCATA